MELLHNPMPQKCLKNWLAYFSVFGIFNLPNPIGTPGLLAIILANCIGTCNPLPDRITQIQIGKTTIILTPQSPQYKLAKQSSSSQNHPNTNWQNNNSPDTIWQSNESLQNKVVKRAFKQQNHPIWFGKNNFCLPNQFGKRMSSLVDKICFPDGIHPGPSKSRSPERL
jgi:hypothetical protein